MRINVLGVINKLSYGIVTCNLIKTLINFGHSPALFPINQVGQECEESEFESLKSAIQNAEFFDKNAPSIKLWHQFNMAESIGLGERIGWPIFELDRFTELELHHLNSLDKIIVSSKWAKTVCENNNLSVPIHIAPLGVDSTIFNHNPISHDIFTMHNIGKIEIRKSHELIPRILSKAFRQDDKFILKMMWRNAFTDNALGADKIKEWEDYYRSYLGNRVIFSERLNSNKEVAQFINCSDLGLYLSKAEGWDLSCLESMSCGVNVVATNYSAHTEYCTEQNSSLIDIDETESALDGMFFNGFGNWANVAKHENEIVEKIRYYYELWKKGNLKFNQAGIDTAKSFSWTNTVNKIEEVICSH